MHLTSQTKKHRILLFLSLVLIFLLFQSIKYFDSYEYTLIEDIKVRTYIYTAIQFIIIAYLAVLFTRKDIKINNYTYNKIVMILLTITFLLGIGLIFWGDILSNATIKSPDTNSIEDLVRYLSEYKIISRGKKIIQLGYEIIVIDFIAIFVYKMTLASLSGKNAE